MNFPGTSNLQRKSNKIMHTKICRIVKCYKKGVLPCGQTTSPSPDRISELSDKE